MDKIMKNIKGLEVDTGLSLSFKTYLEKFLFWSDPLNLESVEKKWMMQPNIQCLSKDNSFLVEIKTIFHNFEKLSFYKT